MNHECVIQKLQNNRAVAASYQLTGEIITNEDDVQCSKWEWMLNFTIYVQSLKVYILNIIQHIADGICVDFEWNKQTLTYTFYSNETSGREPSYSFSIYKHAVTCSLWNLL